MADGSFRAIVPPTTTASTLHGNYKDEAGRMVNFRSTPYSSGFTSGGCYTLTVTRSQPGVTPERKVAVGDFYMQNGMIVAGSKETLTAEEKVNCIGIVFKVGAGSGDNASNYDGKLTAIQGYVVSLRQEWLAWGDASKKWTDVLYDYRGYLNTKKNIGRYKSRILVPRLQMVRRIHTQAYGDDQWLVFSFQRSGRGLCE